MGDRVLDTGHVRLWDADDPTAHFVSATRLARLVDGLQRTIRLLAAQEEGLSVGKRFNPSVEFKQHFTVLLGVPEKGSYSQPVLVVDTRHEYTLEEVPYFPLQTATTVLSAIARKDFDCIQQALPNPRIRREVLETVKEYVPRDKWSLRLASDAQEVDLAAADVSTIEEWLALADIVREIDVIGELIELKFDKRIVTLRYPPTGRHLEASYQIELEEALFAERLGLVQVTGTAILDDEAVPIGLQDVTTIRAVDLSPFEVRLVRYGKVTLTASPAILLTPTLSNDLQLFEAQDDSLGLDAFASTREKLLEAVQEELAFNWDCYALEDPSNLARDARELRERLRQRFEVA